MICFISQQPVRIERREEFGFHFKMFITAVKLKIKLIFWTNQVPNVTLSECGTWLIGFYQDVWSSLCNLLLTLKILWLQWSSLFFSLLFFLKSIPQKWRQSFVNRSVSLVWIMWGNGWRKMLFLAGFTVPSVLILHLSSRVGGIETLRWPAVTQNQRIRLSVISTVIFYGFRHLFIVWHTCCHAVSKRLDSSARESFFIACVWSHVLFL